MNMMTRAGYALMVAMGAAAAGGAIAGEEPTVAVTGDLPVLSAYVWRGQVLNDEAVVQPALNLTKGGFGFNAWGNFNTTDNVTADPDFSEIDLTVSYGRKLGPVQLGAGVIEYVFPNTTYAGTRELYVSASLPDLPIVPTVSLYRDIDEVDGFYGSFGLGYSHAVVDKVTGSLSASVGVGDKDYNSVYFGTDDTALNDVNVGAALTYQALPNLTVTPAIQYTWLPDNDISDAAEGIYLDDSEVVGSLKASYTF